MRRTIIGMNILPLSTKKESKRRHPRLLMSDVWKSKSKAEIRRENEWMNERNRREKEEKVINLVFLARGELEVLNGMMTINGQSSSSVK